MECTMNPAFHLKKAFTLIELLVVLAIMAVLFGLVVPSMTSLLGSTSMGQGGQAVVDQIASARQYATSLNTTTQLRLIKDTSITSSGYNSMQIWVTGTGTGTMVAAGRVVTLPQSVAISEDKTNLSPMLGLPMISTGTMPSTGYTYYAFSIRPSGEVVPVETGTNRASLCLTVVPARLSGTGNTTLPPNYATIQLNPDTGSALLIRP